MKLHLCVSRWTKSLAPRTLSQTLFGATAPAPSNQGCSRPAMTTSSPSRRRLNAGSGTCSQERRNKRQTTITPIMIPGDRGALEGWTPETITARGVTRSLAGRPSHRRATWRKLLENFRGDPLGIGCRWADLVGRGQEQRPSNKALPQRSPGWAHSADGVGLR